ncbi:hypothetical protein CRG98_049376, partial [Punica granatum]
QQGEHFRPQQVQPLVDEEERRPFAFLEKAIVSMARELQFDICA